MKQLILLITLLTLGVSSAQEFDFNCDTWEWRYNVGGVPGTTDTWEITQGFSLANPTFAIDKNEEGSWATVPFEEGGRITMSKQGDADFTDLNKWPINHVGELPVGLHSYDVSITDASLERVLISFTFNINIIE